MKTQTGRWALHLTGGLVALVVIFCAGYTARWAQIQPLHGFVTKLERKIEQQADGPTETEKRVGRIETTFLRLRGDVWHRPQNDWVNGGGLTVRVGELFVVHRTGRILHFVEGTGLRDTALSTPDNGTAAYAELAHSQEWRDYNHKPTKIRFNDILWVADGALHGFALSYTFFDPERVCYGNRLAWLDVPVDAGAADTLTARGSDWKVLYESSPCLELNTGWTVLDGIMAGGRIDYQGSGRSG